MGDTFANPEDYFRQCLAWMASERKLDINAIRANPDVIGYSLTGTQDQGLSGEGLTTTFPRIEARHGRRHVRRLGIRCVGACSSSRCKSIAAEKPSWKPCWPTKTCSPPGNYPVRLQVVGPRNASVFDRTSRSTFPIPRASRSRNSRMPVFAEDVVIDGPSGKYRFLATFQKGGAAAGGDIEFYVADPADMPKVETEVVLWGDDPDLAKWLAANGIKTRPFAAGRQTARGK